MIAGRNSEDYYPLTWIGRVPIYVTTLFVGFHVFGMLVTVVCLAAGQGWAPALASFSSHRVLTQYSLWEFLTYAFVSRPSIWFAIEMLLLYSFGKEVEQFLGRRAFLWLYVALLLAAPVALTVLGLFGIQSNLIGAEAVNFAVFVAFALIYPKAEIFFGIQARWIALVLLAIISLQYVAAQEAQGWISLGVLWLDCLCAYFMLSAHGVQRLSLPTEWLAASRPRPSRRIERVDLRRDEPAGTDPFESIDPLLEKISKHGMASLTKRERERLEKAREALLAREKER